MHIANEVFAGSEFADTVDGKSVFYQARTAEKNMGVLGAETLRTTLSCSSGITLSGASCMSAFFD